MAAERELVDLLLSERLPIDEVRRGALGALPAGHELRELHDVWLGEPPLPGQVAAAVYRIDLSGTPDTAALAQAASRLLASVSLVRPKPKGGGNYDLRPLLERIAVEDAGPNGRGAVVLSVRTRFDPERGAGRPDEVVAALAELVEEAILADRTVRERLVLAAER